MSHVYASCPFCGSDDIGPSYLSFEHSGRTFVTATISCCACGAHGPVRNDYPPDDSENDLLADAIEDWTRAAWNRMPRISPEEADKHDAMRSHDNRIGALSLPYIGAGRSDMDGH